LVVNFKSNLLGYDQRSKVQLCLMSAVSVGRQCWPVCRGECLAPVAANRRDCREVAIHIQY